VIMPKTISLGGKQFEVRELEFRELRRLLPVIHRVGPALARNVITDSVMDELAEIIAAGIGITVEELDALPVKARELGAAFDAVATSAGLAERPEGASGEALVADGTGTTSTLISPPASAGPGTTSTE